MRKRFVTTLIICILCTLCALGFAACGDEKTEEPVSVSGKTFVFVSVHGEYPEGASAETKEEWNGIFEGTNEAYKDALTWTFAEDGTWEQAHPDAEDGDMPNGTYVQNGSIIEITEEGAENSTLTVSGKTFTYSIVIEGEGGSVLLTQVQTFKLLEE